MEFNEEVQIFLKVPVARMAKVENLGVIKDFVPHLGSWVGDTYNAHAMRG
jgi:hypothetical protein